MKLELFNSGTVFFFFAVSSLFIVIIFLSFIFLTKSRNWCVITFTVGKFFQALGIFGFSLGYSLPDFTSLTAGSIFLYIGYAFEIFGITSFDLILRKKRVYTILTATLFFVFLSLISSNFPYYQRAIIFSFAGMFYFGYGGIYLARVSEHSKFKKWIGYTYIFFALIFAVRIISIFIQRDSFQLFSNDSILNLILNLTAYLVILLGSVGLLLMLREQNIKIITNDNIELKKLNSTKDKFFSIIAHDLRGPVGSLYQLIQLLVIEQNEIAAKERKELLNDIYANSRNTFNLLENLLQWSRSESGRISYNPSIIKVPEIVSSTIDLLKDNIRSKSLKVILNIDAGTVAFADENMLQTVLRNLLTNAIKFTPKNGEITISSTEMKNNFIKVSIQDTGLGIDEELLNRLFDLQFEHTSKGTENESGSGLGLKLCKEFSVKNGGDISVESELNKGSTFSFTLPVNEAVLNKS